MLIARIFTRIGFLIYCRPQNKDTLHFSVLVYIACVCALGIPTCLILLVFGSDHSARIQVQI